MPLAKDAVPINGQRLKVALEERGIAQREAGRRIARMWYGKNALSKDEHSVTMSISHVVRGKSGHCDQALRAKLAKLLKVPEQWLAGEADSLPGYSPLRSLQSDDQPLRQQFLRYRMWQTFGPALDRQLGDWEDDDDLRLTMIGFVSSYLCDPLAWRSTLLEPKAAAPATPVDTREAIGAHADAMEHLLEAMRYILQPWIDGEAELSPEAANGINAMNTKHEALLAARLRAAGLLPATARPTRPKRSRRP